MEKGQWIRDLSLQTSVVDGVFAVASAERQNTRTGKAFWKLRLVDSTGSIEGKIWCDNTGVLHPDRLATGDLILIQRGRISEWKGTPQISANTALAVTPEAGMVKLMVGCVGSATVMPVSSQ